MENQEQRPNKEQKKTLVVIGVLAVTTIVLDVLISLITYYVATGKFNKQFEKESESIYVVNEETIQIHDHLLEFLKDQAEIDISGYTPKKIIALTFENGILHVATEDNNNTLTFDVPTSYTSVDEALNLFKDTKPDVNEYTIPVGKEINDDNYFNPETATKGQKHVGHASYIDGIDKKYVSFSGLYDEKNYVTVYHEEYREDGLYNTKKANIDSDPLFYDFLFYIVNN